MNSSKLLYTGSYVPEQVITNEDISKIVDTDDEWIFSRSGISRRHIAEKENTSDLAAKAAMRILEKGNISPEQIELLIVATLSGDFATPSTACLVQGKIGAVNAMAFDINAACSGFLFGLSMADKYIRSGCYQNALVIGAEVLSKHIDWTDRSTCVLFADGAAGAYLERCETGGILAEEMYSNGAKGMCLTGGYVPLVNAFYQENNDQSRYIHMDGKAVFTFATKVVPPSILSILNKAKISPEEIKYIVPHQANSRIIDILARKTKIPADKFYKNMVNYGNTSSASIPIALNELWEKGMLAPGDKIVLTGFGGGLTWGSMVVEI